jgi:hypothetical protein
MTHGRKVRTLRLSTCESTQQTERRPDLLGEDWLSRERVMGNGFEFAFCGKEVKVIRGESGGVWSLKLANPRSRGLVDGNPRNSRCGAGE